MPALPPVDPARLVDLLDPSTGMDWHVSCVAETGSTNVDLAEIARHHAVEGTALVTESQTRGRARFTRTWTDVPGSNIAMSVLLRPRREPSAWGWLPLIAGLALHDALVEAGVPAVLKWPNDILVESGERPGKLVGILAALEPTEEGPACILGWGINVGMDVDELPVPTATSVGLCGGRTDKTRIVADSLNSLAGWYRRWSDGEDLRADYESRCGTVGRRVRVQLDAEQGDGDVTEGVAVGVDDEGSLKVMIGTRVVPISAGDAIHVR